MLETEFYTGEQAAKILEMSGANLSVLLSQNRFDGAFKVGRTWLIPKESVNNFERKKPGNFTNHRNSYTYNKKDSKTQTGINIIDSNITEVTEENIDETYSTKEATKIH